MIGNGYRAPGITVAFHKGTAGRGADGWTAEAEYLDDGNGDDLPDAGRISTQGRLHTSYKVKVTGGASELVLAAVVDAVKADAERLGIRFDDDAGGGPRVFYKGDGESDDCPPPDDWRVMVDRQAVRLGWLPLYSDIYSKRLDNGEMPPA
jgi:hypothetical protein